MRTGHGPHENDMDCMMIEAEAGKGCAHLGGRAKLDLIVVVVDYYYSLTKHEAV